MSSQLDELETPLLHSQPAKATPLPWGQLSIILFVQLAEPLTAQVIYPFAPQVSIDLKRRDAFRSLSIALAHSRHRCHEGRRNQGRILCWTLGTLRSKRIALSSPPLYFLAISFLCSTGHDRSTLESSIRSHWSKACHSHRLIWIGTINVVLRVVKNLLGLGIKVG